MSKTVFPHSLDLLTRCKTFDDLAAWRNQHLLAIKAANLQGEIKQSAKSQSGEVEERKFQKDFPGRIYDASKLLDDKVKEIELSFKKDIDRFKIALSGYTDLTDTLDKVKKSLDQVTHLLTEKVRAEIQIREKTQ